MPQSKHAKDTDPKGSDVLATPRCTLAAGSAFVMGDPHDDVVLEGVGVVVEQKTGMSSPRSVATTESRGRSWTC